MLTRRQKDIYEYIAEATQANKGVPPTFEEIAVRFKTTRSNAFRMVGALEERGYIRRLRNRARAIEIIRPQQIEWFRFDDETKTIVPLE